ncbi:MAG TPA: hypothetical protein VN577_14190 [Terriglobales bacterium]|nr:hypothetical protein [Terriglobales bacterium]
MNILRAITLVLCVSCLLGFEALSQVRVTLPKERFKAHERIDVTIKNVGRQDISFCVDFGRYSVTETELTESTPTPVYVEAYEKGWHTLLLGSDLGNGRSSVPLQAGQTHEYPFRLVGKGKMRLVLWYWPGESDRTCENPPNRKVAKSKVFFVE